MSHETKRFRTHGVAHDGQAWQLVPCGVVFAQQVELIRPTPHSADGTVAGAGHDKGNPNSDHTVWPKSGAGYVYAIDVGDSEGTVGDIWEQLRLSRDARIMYGIHKRRIFSSYAAHGYPAWTWRPYSGSNPHDTHGHLSWQNPYTGRLTYAQAWAMLNDRSPWQIGNVERSGKMKIIDVQKALNEAGITDYEGKKLVEDGVYGKRTHSALVKAFKSNGGVTEAKVKEIVKQAKLAY